MTTEPRWKAKTAPESRRAVFAAAVVVIAGRAQVASSLRLDPFWLLPTISTILLVASVAVYESQSEPGRLAGALTFAFNAVLLVANAVSLVLLVRGVFLGSDIRPEARAHGYADGYPDFVFPQQ